MYKNALGKTKGFTMVEVITTLGIFLILGGLTLPVGLNFYRNQKLNTFSHLLADRTEKARSFAKNQRGDTAWGLRVATDSYIIFKGANFESREQSFDQTYEIPRGIRVEQDEVVFEKLSGQPTVAFNVTISGAPQANAVSVSSIGRVRLDLDVSLEGD